MNPSDPRSGDKQWKAQRKLEMDARGQLLVLHGLRDKQERGLQPLSEAIRGVRAEHGALQHREGAGSALWVTFPLEVPAADFFKRRIMICTERRPGLRCRGVRTGSPGAWTSAATQ